MSLILELACSGFKTGFFSEETFLPESLSKSRCLGGVVNFLVSSCFLAKLKLLAYSNTFVFSDLFWLKLLKLILVLLTFFSLLMKKLYSHDYRKNLKIIRSIEWLCWDIFVSYSILLARSSISVKMNFFSCKDNPSVSFPGINCKISWKTYNSILSLWLLSSIEVPLGASLEILSLSPLRSSLVKGWFSLLGDSNRE